MKNLREILDEYNHEVTFPFLGNTLVVSKERNVYNQLRLKYNKIADNAKAEFAERLKKYSDPKSMLDGMLQDFLLALKSGFDELTQDAISIDCYTLDMEAAAKRCMKKGYFDSFEKATDEYKNAYVAILTKHVNAAANAYEDAENHPNLQVATIGGSLGDVFANQMKAELTNAVIGGIYSSAADEKVAQIADLSDKEVAQFFNNQTYKNNIINSVWTCAANLRLVISNDLSKEYNLEIGGWVTNDESAKAESMHNNMNSIKLPEDKEKEFAMSILQLNPFNYTYYKNFLTKFFDNAREILDIADFFHINLSGSIKSIMADFAKNHAGNSFEDIKNCRKLVKEKISELGFPDGSDEIAEVFIQTHSAILINNYMIENMGETRSEVLDCFNKMGDIEEDIQFDEKYRNEAYEAFNEKIEILDNELVEQLTKWVDENIGATEDEAHKCREELTKQIEEQDLNPEKAVNIYKTIDDRLKKLDQEYRTVVGFTFPTRESADEVKAVIEEHKEILNKPAADFIFRANFTEHIALIRTIPLPDKLVSHFAGKYEQYLKEFDKKCKNAKLHDDKLKGQKKTLKSFARSMFVSDDKQQKAWEELTHNGQYSLNEIMGILDDNDTNNAPTGHKGLFSKK